MSKQYALADIPAEKFEFAQMGETLSDKKLDTKPIGYFKDAFIRFRKNKSSVAAAVIIILLLLFAIVGPIVAPFGMEYIDNFMRQKTPRLKVFAHNDIPFWDGCKTETINESTYWKYVAMGEEMGQDVNPIKKVYEKSETVTYIGTAEKRTTVYKVRLDTYTMDGAVYKNLTETEYKNLQTYQNETGIQIIYPAVPETEGGIDQYNANSWYDTKNKLPKGINADHTAVDEWTNLYIAYTGTDGYDSLRVEGDTPLYNYAIKKAGNVYRVRVNYNRYFEYINGKEANFIFGSNDYGRDIFVRLANGARFSFLLAISVSLINLSIGAVYGAIEGYYGGAADMIMERVVEILSGVPFMVVVVLFKLHLANKVGMVGCLLFAFVVTGWIGMAGRVRTQFYRFKHQEYVLAARTLGASDGRLIFKHIFPNALGTIITSCVLVIPGVIFSESSLSYLGIINLDGTKVTSVGTLLADGSGGMLRAAPHIILFPALFISLLEISFNLFGNGLRDAFNPSLRGVDG
ncbi:MAG: ABC transporter permease [Clostridia bacterium]|nr:ABC transporter permease [Clostridia bacterium]